MNTVSEKPIFFKTPEEFRSWLEKNHKIKTELYVGYYKKASGKPTMTWSQSVDEALCFGWIDGIRRSIDKESYCNRFTPRRETSRWSSVNIKKVEELIKSGMMQPAGLQIYNKRKEEMSGISSYESEAKQLHEEFENKFKENKTAWEYFSRQAPSYKRTIIHWILSAKQEKTKLARLEKTITESEKQKRVYA
ncbi:MAG: YdeI/OmpD-associated family protein [Bacteroidales bacterium]|nr:YdeI/OmpD-associated family protein [Bacteroidales bacterium]